MPKVVKKINLKILTIDLSAPVPLVTLGTSVTYPI